MNIPLDEVVHFDVVTHSPTTGAITDADSPPTFGVFEEATDTPIVAAVTMTKRTSITGSYRGTFIASVANNFDIGKFYSVVVTGTVGTIQGRTVAMHFRLVAAESLAGLVKSDLSAIDGDTTAATNLRRSASSIYVGTVTGATTTTTLIDSALTQTLTDHFKGKIIHFVSGALFKAATDITAFTPASDRLTFTALPAAPSAGDIYVIV